MKLSVLSPSTTLWTIIVLTTDFWKYLDGSCGFGVRYKRDVTFDGILPTPESYYIDSITNLTLASCTIKCFQSPFMCTGFLFSFQQMSCKLLDTFLTDFDKNDSFVGGDWEYWSRLAENLSLNKTVTASSNYNDHIYQSMELRWSYLVDGITNAPGKFATFYEPYPWATIDLARYSIIKNVIIFNRVDDHGRWLHSLEIRIGNSSVWSEMSTCGTFPGPSKTGAVITIECRPSRNGRYVTLRIVELNYITDDMNASNGNNALILEEVFVNGLYA